ncbi:MAG: lipopolysaccharide biosynthesis protein [Bacteroidales bacterium]
MDSKSKNAILWNAVERFSVQGVQFLLGIIIARILTPQDYGLIAMLTIFTSIAQIFVDSGFANALIQKQDRTDVDYSTAFYFNLVISFLCYMILYAASGSIASFYDEIQLKSITKFVALSLIINAFSTVQRSKLIIELKFSLIAKITLFSTISSGLVGLALAYKGMGVWALVYQALLNNLLNTLLLMIFSKWKPLFVFSLTSFKSLFSFGSKILLGGLMHSIYVNLYSLVIGKKFEATELGLFNRSFSLVNVVSSNITTIMQRSFYPIGCQLQDDNIALKNYFIRIIRMSSFVVFPIMMLLSVLSKPIILILLSEKWVEISSYMSIMCIAYMWDVIMRLNWDILSIKGRTDLSLRSEIIKKIVSVIILVATIPFGLKVMCYGLVLYSLSDILIITYYTKKVNVVTLKEEVVNISDFLFASLVSIIPVFFLQRIIENNYLNVILSTVLALFVYSIVLIYMKNIEIFAIINNFKQRFFEPRI